MRVVAVVAAGGAVGASLRHLLLVAFPVAPATLPMTVLGINLAGALLLGVVGGVLLARRPDAAALLAFATTGVLGSFTTFSAVALDLVLLGRAGRPGLVAAYAAVSIIGGLAAAVVGLRWGRRLA
jgi:CrcB protein